MKKKKVTSGKVESQLMSAPMSIGLDTCADLHCYFKLTEVPLLL